MRQKSRLEQVQRRVFEIDVGILKELEERSRLVGELKELYFQKGKHSVTEAKKDQKVLLAHIHKTAPDLTLPDEKIMLLWGKVVELTGTAYTESAG